MCFARFSLHVSQARHEAYLKAVAQYADNNPDKAFQLFMDVAKQGHADALAMTGFFFDRYVDAEDSGAVKLFGPEATVTPIDKKPIFDLPSAKQVTT